MRRLEGVYLIDRLENASALADLGPNFAKAADFIRRGSLAALAPGRHEIDGERVFVNADVAELVAPSERRAELHRRYFDIQVPLEADELIGLAAFDPAAPGSFDETRDVGFYGQPTEPCEVRVGEFALIWPGTCLHAPACTAGAPRRARKLVFKVAAEQGAVARKRV